MYKSTIFTVSGKPLQVNKELLKLSTQSIWYNQVTIRECIKQIICVLGRDIISTISHMI